MATELRAAKKERDFYLQQVGRAKALEAIQQRKEVRGMFRCLRHMLSTGQGGARWQAQGGAASQAGIWAALGEGRPRIGGGIGVG